MDAREVLRRYLEQRRELGEREFVLDSISVADAMRALGAKMPVENEPTATGERVKGGTGERTSPGVADLPKQRSGAAHVSDDWRETLRAAGAEPAATKRAPAPPPPALASSPPLESPPLESPPPLQSSPGENVAAAPADDVFVDAPPGLIVGTTTSELFGGPLSKLASLDDVAASIAACTGCSLHAAAKNPVPGEGNSRAELVCVGEAPGQTEDEQGRPFVGAAGQLLTKILEAGMEIPREKVFICNVLKHRPPGNRNPAPDEIVACRPFLMRQLELIRPKVILALGTFAAQTLLETKLAIGKLRGQVHRFYGIPLVVTYHPAALLRNPNWKRPTYDDVKLARRLLDRPRDGA